jgi:hypothetical protein
MEQGPKPQPTEFDVLAKIEGHLRSIRSAINFFVFITVLAIILQGCNLLMGI